MSPRLRVLCALPILLAGQAVAAERVRPVNEAVEDGIPYDPKLPRDAKVAEPGLSTLHVSFHDGRSSTLLGRTVTHLVTAPCPALVLPRLMSSPLTAALMRGGEDGWAYGMEVGCYQWEAGKRWSECTFPGGLSGSQQAEAFLLLPVGGLRLSLKHEEHRGERPVKPPRTAHSVREYVIEG